MEDFKLNNGEKIPAIGMGTFPMKGLKLIKAVHGASRSGYQLYDTSVAYGNERELGMALKLSSLKREQQYIITKMGNRQQETSNARTALKDSMRRLHVKYVDLYLLHWPYPGKFMDNWKEMEDLYDEGLVKAIGVSNFHEHHLEELLSKARIVPAVNEIELHPLLSQEPLVKYCKNAGIQVIAYSPFARMSPELIKHPVLESMTKKYGKKATQIILRWAFQHGYITIPKASTVERLRENISIFDFEIETEDMLKLDAMNQNKRFRFNPDTCDYTKI